MLRSTSGSTIDRVLLYAGDGADESTDEHEGFVAGRFPDGTLTTIWTDVRPHPGSPYAGLVPRCECGWRGPEFTVTPEGYAACERLWRERHLASFLRAREPNFGRPSTVWRPRVIEGGFVPEDAPSGDGDDRLGDLGLRDGA